MPLLDRHGAKAEIWARSEGAAIGTVSHALVEWAALPEALAQKTRDQRIGVVIPNTVRIPELKLLMRQLSLIAMSESWRIKSLSSGMRTVLGMTTPMRWSRVFCASASGSASQVTSACEILPIAAPSLRVQISALAP